LYDALFLFLGSLFDILLLPLDFLLEFAHLLLVLNLDKLLDLYDLLAQDTMLLGLLHQL
jgi:hypothetical protein